MYSDGGIDETSHENDHELEGVGTGAEDTGDDEPIGDWDQFDPELLRSACAIEDANDCLPDTSDTGVAGVIIKWIVLLLLPWKSRYAVSDAAIESIFQIFCTIFSYFSGLVSLWYPR